MLAVARRCLPAFAAGPKISDAEREVKYDYNYLSARVFAHHIAQKLGPPLVLAMDEHEMSGPGDPRSDKISLS
jgi:hypothetical protein